MTTVLFDAEGVRWIDRLPAFAAAIRQLSQAQLRDYLVINMGFVAVRLHRTGTEIRLRPSHASELAIVNAYSYLAARHQPRIVTQLFCGRQWTPTLLVDDCATDARAFDLMLALIASKRSRSQASIIHRRISARQLASDCPLADALKIWSETKSGAALEQHARTHLSGRFVWVEQTAEGEPLRLAGVGDGFPNQISKLLMTSIGRRIEETVNSTYGKYCADVYSTVAKSRRPLLEDVDALVVAQERSAPMQRSYRRLILPLPTSRDTARLLCLSIEDPGIDLRRAVA